MLINQEKDRIISDYMLGKLPNKTFEELRGDINQDFLNSLLEENDILERYRSFAKADAEKALHKAMEIIHPNRNAYGWKVAAVLLCMIATGAYFWFRDYSQVVPPVIDQDVEICMKQSIKEQLVSKKQHIHNGKETAYTQALDANYLSTFHLSTKKAEEMLQAENITTYYNKEHWLTLDDGTIVHLDRNSRIIYPEHFSRFGTREVVLDGSAYFMVAHDNVRRFIVHTKFGNVIDYGTEFFVSGKYNFEAVLVSGSASFTPFNHQEILLQPGEKVAVSDQDGVTKSKVDVEEYKAWNTGKFVFAGKDLQTVMSIISRWYGVNVYYHKEEYRHILITGNYDRCPDIMPLLESLEYVTNLQFITNGNTIEIK